MGHVREAGDGVHEAGDGVREAGDGVHEATMEKPVTSWGEILLCWTLCPHFPAHRQTLRAGKGGGWGERKESKVLESCILDPVTLL